MYAQKDNLKNVQKNCKCEFWVHVEPTMLHTMFESLRNKSRSLSRFFLAVETVWKCADVDFKRFQLNVYAHFTDQNTSTTWLNFKKFML